MNIYQSTVLTIARLGFALAFAAAAIGALFFWGQPLAVAAIVLAAVFLSLYIWLQVKSRQMARSAIRQTNAPPQEEQDAD
jgi:hypothetical protein